MENLSASESATTTNYPYILFRLKKDFYAINCKNVASIMQMTDYEQLPNTPENVEGIFKFSSQVIPIISLRKLFSFPTLEQESAEFSAMLDQRKQDHINWVKELNRCVKQETPFTLAMDPHKCAFGRWYDRYESDSPTIKFHLRKIEEPHRLLHECAQRAQNCAKDHDSCSLETCLSDTLSDAESNYMPKIIELLDEAKDMFAAHLRSMLIVIDTGKDMFAVIVDEVLAVEDLIDIATEDQVDKLKGSRYITEIKKSAKSSRLVFLINELKLAEISENFKLKSEKE